MSFVRLGKKKLRVKTAVTFQWKTFFISYAYNKHAYSQGIYFIYHIYIYMCIYYLYSKQKRKC